MRVAPWPSKRGLTLLELLLAISITAMVAAAITGMMSVVSAGVGTRRDARDVMIRAHTAQIRLEGYLLPARCVLRASGGNLTLWLHDARESQTVHASEIRWLTYDAGTGSILLQRVAMPDVWSKAQTQLEDDEFPMTTNWDLVLKQYQSLGWISSLTLVDGLSAATVQLDALDPLASRNVIYDLSFQSEGGAVNVQAAVTIRQHRPPTA